MSPCAAALVDRSWELNDTACEVYSFVSCTLMTASNMSLAAISVDRALAVNKPFHYPNLVTFCRVKLVLLFVWIHAFCLSLIPAIGDWYVFEAWDMICNPRWEKANPFFAVMSTILSFALPSFLLLISNLSIISAIRKSRSVVFQISGSETMPQICAKNHAKTLRSLYVLVVAYFICTPTFYILKLRSVLERKNILQSKFPLVPIILQFATAALNPLIYFILRKEHREACLVIIRSIFSKFRKFIHDICGHYEPDSEPEFPFE
ncbi:beta-2 adrenergic receptor-like [Stegodyphus dumicola]|uniref:beta-2 adrenergic receptor-like n=1 Tax=Stegodyphus dumicola TaxID=202533 RepID=UPI0015ACD85F|nr:beta-2 adrenergic receptor-like [Stegodyphus dumicola]